MHDAPTVNKAVGRAGYAGEYGYSYRNTPCLALFLFFFIANRGYTDPLNWGFLIYRG